MYYIGVDLGGTNIKVGIVDDKCNILAEENRLTNLPRSAEAVCDDITEEILAVTKQFGINLADISGIGIGCPGTVNPITGYVDYSNNLDWHSFPMRKYLADRIGFNVAMGNDANVAALGEVCAGSAKGAQSAVIITLGTGVGSGVVIDNKILTGYNSAASELGHMVIEKGGRPCTCGRLGCFEAYASATGLINMTSDAIKNNPLSKLAQIAETDRHIGGRTAFQAAKQGDIIGKQVVDLYISYLACGLINIVNIFQPEIISLGGGVANEGETLLVPLREKVYAEIFGGCGSKYTTIVSCTLGYKAGIIGAAMLAARKE